MSLLSFHTIASGPFPSEGGLQTVRRIENSPVWKCKMSDPDAVLHSPKSILAVVVGLLSNLGSGAANWLQFLPFHLPCPLFCPKKRPCDVGTSDPAWRALGRAIYICLVKHVPGGNVEKCQRRLLLCKICNHDRSHFSVACTGKIVHHEVPMPRVGPRWYIPRVPA